MPHLGGQVKPLLTHDGSCTRIILRFQPLIDVLDVIFFESGDAEAKGVKDQLL